MFDTGYRSLLALLQRAYAQQGRLGTLSGMVSEASDWVTQLEAARILGLGGSGSAIPKMVRRGLLHPRQGRPSLSRAEVERLRDARAEQARVRALAREAEQPSPPPQPPDDHPDWVQAAQLAEEMGVGGPWVVHQRARRGRLPYTTSADGTRWFRRDLVDMAVRAQVASRSKKLVEDAHPEKAQLLSGSCDSG